MTQPLSPRDGESACSSKEPPLDAALVERIGAGDPQASAAFLAMVHDRACRIVQDALTSAGPQRSIAVERLIRAYRRDDLQIQAALLSAQTSFQRHLLDLARSAEVPDGDDYVTALITLAYNRWQRRNYGDKRSRVQAALGASGNETRESESALSRAADPRPGPDNRPVLADFYEKLVEEIHFLCSELKPGEPEVVYLRLFHEFTYEQIAREVGKSTAGVHRICQQVVTHLRRRFRDSVC
jgi:hypothetical protein